MVIIAKFVIDKYLLVVLAATQAQAGHSATPEEQLQCQCQPGTGRTHRGP